MFRAVPRSLNMSRMAGRGLRCVGIGSLFSLPYFVGGPGGSEEEEEGDLTTKNKYLDPIAANSEEEGGKEGEGPGDLLCVSREGIYRVSCRSRGKGRPLKAPSPSSSLRLKQGGKKCRGDSIESLSRIGGGGEQKI